MLITNNKKSIKNINFEEDMGSLYYYVLDTKTCIVKYVIFTANDQVYYAKSEDIVQLNNDRILIDSSNKGLPEDISSYTRIDPTAHIVDREGMEHSGATHLDVTGTKINYFVIDNTSYPTKKVLSSSYYYIVFDSMGKKPEPAPPKPPVPPSKDKSIDYTVLLDKIANKSIYACNNTPIIIKGEAVKLGNILNAILNHKFLDLISAVQDN